MTRHPWYHKLEAGLGRPGTPQSFGPLEHRYCPMCGERENQPILENQYYALAELDVMSIVECESCSLMFTNPIPSLIWNQTFLNPQVNTFWTEPVWMTLEWQRQWAREKFTDGLRILRRLTPAGTLLDVGTGPGLFVRMAQEAGYRATGLDILPEGVERARGHNIPVIYSTVSDVSHSQKFSIVTLWCVIAHDPKCVDLLKDCYQLLEPGGTILIETPNMTLWRTLRRSRSLLEKFHLVESSHDELGAYGHINHFTVATLSRLLEATGFKEIRFHRIRNYSTEQGVMDFGKHLLFSLSGSVINFCFPMVATARK